MKNNLISLEEKSETVADFTTISRNGVSAKEVLKELHKLNACFNIEHRCEDTYKFYE